MILHLSSDDPACYNKIKFKSSFVNNECNVMWRVSNLSTIASFSIVTNEDYMKIKTASGYELKYVFEEHGAYDKYSFINDINNLLSGQIVPEEGLPFELSIQMNDKGLIDMYGSESFSIVDATHRVKLLFGMYHSDLPIESNDNVIHFVSCPYLCLGNILYLTARTDAVCLTNARGDEESISIAYKVNEILYTGFPIASKMPGQWNMIAANQLQQLEFQLCDFMMEPIQLHAPLYITVEIESIYKNNIKAQSLTYLSEI